MIPHAKKHRDFSRRWGDYWSEVSGLKQRPKVSFLTAIYIILYNLEHPSINRFFKLPFYRALSAAMATEDYYVGEATQQPMEGSDDESSNSDEEDPATEPCLVNLAIHVKLTRWPDTP